jgi:DHA3 family macrolide efflux protein-like MFS transporter
VFYAFMFLVGLFVPLFSTPVMTLLQETVAPEMQGRVFSYVGIVMALSTPVGIAVFGPLADVISVQALLVIGGAAMIVVMVVAILVPSGRAAIAAAREKDPGAAAPNPGAGNEPSGG